MKLVGWGWVGVQNVIAYTPASYFLQSFILHDTLVTKIVLISDNWASALQNLQQDLCDQRRLRSACAVWSVFADRTCLIQPPGFPKWDKRKLLLYGVCVQVDLSLCWSHSLIVGSVVCWLKYYIENEAKKKKKKKKKKGKHSGLAYYITLDKGTRVGWGGVGCGYHDKCFFFFFWFL